jgi:hypothetical protein
MKNCWITELAAAKKPLSIHPTIQPIMQTLTKGKKLVRIPASAASQLAIGFSSLILLCLLV